MSGCDDAWPALAVCRFRQKKNNRHTTKENVEEAEKGGACRAVKWKRFITSVSAASWRSVFLCWVYWVYVGAL